MYSEKVMEHFSDPKNAGAIENADGVGEVGNPVCGDMMTFYIKVDDDRLTDVKFKTFGCVAAIAVSSMVSEMAKNKTLSEAKSITKKAVAEALDGLPKEKMHCSNLGAKALAEAIDDYERKRSGEPPPAPKPKKKKRAKRQVTCSHCQERNPITAKFCMSCGEKIGD
ncbi:MAG: Fe-S cluster assembly scaffold protein NifU [Deltaproteobacteria bacterium]|nr:Fe-S cluster assembly scaffold protein NifU [Deltaproteobacteria bacterium]